MDKTKQKANNLMIQCYHFGADCYSQVPRVVIDSRAFNLGRCFTQDKQDLLDEP